MSTRLVALRNRVVEIEKLADELLELAEKLSNGENVQPALSVAGQKWYSPRIELRDIARFRRFP